ncbi:hypothetical protein DICPUDRAFT_76207 [Dictyostelium purpureum]|uniref:ATP synthase mitochondrial F1 complex assembly factor 1 n=1 Tax=Dictyostelium purpureum TaxID=5786 RepID=F0ZCX5_DICPU|nr:uncharacterized protein DICPUDRAFT_76207 [Dictyostelium purpureum]EGC38214.1 hypothetical protein DICPUDRAFT_76207 [Dictyostelium purpureum]|eukprot:XP_003285252.1 hypothetical protein DICPUDRAFT_76207 [Dictyostelium purpureum]
MKNNKNNKFAGKKPAPPTKPLTATPLSQTAAALLGNKYYSTKPDYVPKPYLGPPGKLNDVVKLELLEKEDASTVKQIWLQYHLQKECLCAVIPSDIYKKLISRSKECPLFIIPLPGDKGFISILYQNQGDHLVFTYLEQFKKHSVNAVPWLIASHYTDFIDSKGIVLMRAEPNLEVLNNTQAQYLYNQIQSYLLDDTKYKIMETFTKRPHEFDFNLVIKDMEKMSLLDNKQSEMASNVIEFEKEAELVNESKKE